MRNYLLLLRPRQWFKNIFVFAGLLFSKEFYDPNAVLTSLLTFVVFCVLSSGVYVLNDICDYDEDRSHPVKSKRPIAAGLISRNTGLMIALVCFVLALTASYQVNRWLFLVCVIYGIVSVLYSVVLKHVIILDVLVVALGYVLRAIAGAVAIQVFISSWLLLCSLLLALLIVIAKRRNELEILGAENAVRHRKTLAHYPIALLNQMIAIVSAACIVSYCLYTLAPETIAKFHTRNLLLTVPFVLYGVFRYLYLTFRKQDKSPEHLLITDIPLQICLVLWAVACIVILIVS
ncbi:decaprenyl-phosphate phosphoribosyltransferase [candidate division WOR-3 bacterium]|nr:decaprenyl-phosphate phosphoribosyltransferase [candidate division WOR-3 bacterium]